MRGGVAVRRVVFVRLLFKDTEEVEGILIDRAIYMTEAAKGANHRSHLDEHVSNRDI